MATTWIDVPQRLAGGDPRRPRIGPRAAAGLPQPHHGRGTRVPLVDLEPHEGQTGGRPPTATRRSAVALDGRFTHDDGASSSEEGGGALGKHRRRREGSGDHRTVGAAMCRVTTHLLGPGGQHLDAGPEVEGGHGISEEGGAAHHGVEQHPAGGRQERGEDQPRDAASAPEVDHRPVTVPELEQRKEGTSVVDVRLDGSRSEEPEVARPLEHGGQAVAALAGAHGHSGLMTTRRSGSSPSELEITPSSSLTVSWTTLRSGGLIASRATGSPESST